MKTDKNFHGSIKLNNMMPVPLSEVSEYNLQGETDLKYKNVIVNQISWLQKNSNNVLNAARNIYNIKTNENKNINDNNRKFFLSIMPFKTAEEKCDEFVKSNKEL